MASHFKNRLVGVTILVTSVVIFLPSIIDGKKTVYQDEFVAMPIKPKQQTHRAVSEQNNNHGKAPKSEVIDEQWKIEDVAETLTIAATPEVEEKASSSQADINSSANAAIPETAWTIQLGAFQNAQNINILLKKLHKAGFQAHTIPSEVIDGELTRVFIGPDISQTKLEKQLPQLKRLTQLQGKVLPFNAVNP